MIPRILDMLFLSAPYLAGDDVRQRSEERRRYRFYPRHPRGWRLAAGHRRGGALGVSIHATLAGGDFAVWPLPITRIKFLSTPPSRVATTVSRSPTRARKSFYPRHPRGWRRVRARVDAAGNQVSIHATLAGGDRMEDLMRDADSVSIHATLAGGD